MANTVIMPKLGFDMAEGTLVRWVIGEGASVIKGAVLAEIETDKATVEVESSYEGVVLRHLVNKGDVVPVNTPIALIGDPGEKDSAKTNSISVDVKKQDRMEIENRQAPAASGIPAQENEPGLPGGVKASPLARRIASERGIDIKQIVGSGPGKRVIKKDVESFLVYPADESKTQVQSAQEIITSAEITTASPSLAYSAKDQADEVIAIPRLRAAIGRRMVEAKAPVPHFYVTHEYDLNALMLLRKQVNGLLQETEKLSVNDFIIKAVGMTLRKFLNLNATIKDNRIIRFGSVHIGVAVAVDNGLLTVVCKNADQKPIRQIAADIRSMASRAREGKVRPEDIEGSTFSISNLGMFDVESFIAIINPPEAAILAVGSAKEVPVVENGVVKPGWRMKATISVDHRISDGVEAAKFLQSLAQSLEQPLTLLL